MVALLDQVVEVCVNVYVSIGAFSLLLAPLGIGVVNVGDEEGGLEGFDATVQE